MTGREEVPWLTVRHDEIERLDRLAAIVDDLSDDPGGLAAALRRTPTYVRALSSVLPPPQSSARPLGC